MTILHKYILFQSLIVTAFAIGFLLRKRHANPERLSSRLVMANLVLIEPPIALWSIWGLALGADLIVLPAAGVALVLAGFAFGVPLARLLGLSGRRRATFLISASLANHGFTMGGIVCYLLMGERGLGLSFIFVSYFSFYLYAVVFPYAEFHTGASRPLGERLRELVFNARNMPLYAACAGMALSAAGIGRPAAAVPIDALLMASVAAYYLALGLNFALDDVRVSMGAHVALGALKFALVPLCAIVPLAFLEVDPAVKSVVIVQSFAPAAVYSVVTAVVFRLDARLASGMFVVNTLVYLGAVLPAIFLFGRALLPR